MVQRDVHLCGPLIRMGRLRYGENVEGTYVSDLSLGSHIHQWELQQSKGVSRVSPQGLLSAQVLHMLVGALTQPAPRAGNMFWENILKLKVWALGNPGLIILFLTGHRR